MSEEQEAEAELRNPFPSPPSHYTNYTPHNLALLKLLNDRFDPISETRSQQEILADQTDVPQWSLKQLEKPRVDWILEDGHYNVFGETWYVKETIPSLAEVGGHQLYPADPSIDRRPALLNILHSLLVTYSMFTSSLLLPPPTEPDREPEWQRHAQWINIMAQNIMAAANDLRPVQARAHLEAMMKRQLELRREETDMLNQKCDVLEAKLAELRASAQVASHANLSKEEQKGPPIAMDIDSKNIQEPGDSKMNTSISAEDAFKWAEEV